MTTITYKTKKARYDWRVFFIGVKKMSDWKENVTGNMPCHGDRMIEVMNRDLYVASGRADGFYWGIDGSDLDILKWRFAEKKEEPKPEWDGEGLPPVGAECEVCNCGSNWQSAKVLFMGTGLCVVDHGYGDQHYHLNSVKFRKQETPEQREERERLEAAYDLYLEFHCAVGRSVVSLEDFEGAEFALKGYLSIVDKTGYRKAK